MFDGERRDSRPVEFGSGHDVPLIGFTRPINSASHFTARSIAFCGNTTSSSSDVVTSREVGTIAIPIEEIDRANSRFVMNSNTFASMVGRRVPHEGVAPFLVAMQIADGKA